MKGLTLLDVVVVIAVLALLVYLVRLDWRHDEPASEAPTTTARPSA